MCMSIYTIETYCIWYRIILYNNDDDYQSSSSSLSLLFIFGINVKSNAASTLVEQCGQVKLFSNH